MIVQQWTGREAQLLRLAMRMSVDTFAGHLGLSSRAVAKWEARGSTLTPRHDMQAILDAAFAQATDEQRERFEANLAMTNSSEARAERGDRLDSALARPSGIDLVTVAHLRERIRQLEDAYDSTPSTALLGSAGQVHGQIVYLRERVASSRVRRALLEAEAESATFMGQLTWDV